MKRSAGAAIYVQASCPPAYQQKAVDVEVDTLFPNVAGGAGPVNMVLWGGVGVRAKGFHHLTRISPECVHLDCTYIRIGCTGRMWVVF
jgi:hypothetical protein